MKNKHSLFLTFEGGEGAGKTTLIHKVEQALLQRGFQVLVTREPGGSSLGNQIRKWLLESNKETPISSKAELLLFLAARAQHLDELILPALQQGKVVLCDRFNDSTVAYQGVARNLGEEFVQNLCDTVCQGTTPDLTLYLDVDPQEGLKRTLRTAKENAGVGQMDRIEAEKLDFHQRVRQGMQGLAKKFPKRIRILDANASEEDVFAKAMVHVDFELGKSL